jgi:hypothetical protein
MNSFYEELGGTYHQEGDYLIPDLAAPPSPPIGIWGLRRKNYLLKHREPIYNAMLLRGELHAHLEEIDRQAQEMLYRLIDQMAHAEGITEQLKADDQIAWVGAMNNIRARAEEVVYADLIYD